MIPFYLRLLPFLWLTPALAQQELSPLIQDWNDKTRSVEDRLQTAKDLHELRGLLEPSCGGQKAAITQATGMQSVFHREGVDPADCE